MRVLLSVEWVLGVILDRVTTNHDSGTLRETGNRTEMALDGKAYFMVETPEVFAIQKMEDFTLVRTDT